MFQREVLNSRTLKSEVLNSKILKSEVLNCYLIVECEEFNSDE